VVTTVIKFEEGGWVTLLATGALVAFCAVVRRHYRRVRQLLATLDQALTNLPRGDKAALAARKGRRIDGRLPQDWLRDGQTQLPAPCLSLMMPR